ncbi:MAG: SpoIIE family protein phosphatase [Lentisphaeria bacterium]|nr:SpoIIE family protein phosphatase [Lentisphaeria bacterium]
MFIEAVIIFFIVTLVFFVLFGIYQKSHNTLLCKKLREITHQKAEISNFVGLFSRSLAGEGGIQSSMNTAARYVAEQVEAESVGIYELVDDNFLICGISGAYPLIKGSSSYVMTKPKHILNALRNDPIPRNEGIIGQAAARMDGIRIEEAWKDPRFAVYQDVRRISSVIAVPMVREAKVTGVICAVNNRKPGPFDIDQLAKLRFISSQINMAQNLVQIYSDLSNRQRIDQELAFARNVQQSLLPKCLPQWQEYSLNVFTRSAKEVNGDFYDYIDIDENRALIIIGDACGKGVPACMMSAMTRSFARSTVEHFTTLESFLETVNKNLNRDIEMGNFITLGCCLLDRKNNILEFGRAGHTELLTYVRGHVRTFFPDGSGLGLLPEGFAEFETISMEFRPGTSFLMYSDGITEAVNADKEEFGTTRLIEVFRQSRAAGDSSDETFNKILEAVKDFSVAVEQADDQTLVLIHRD